MQTKGCYVETAGFLVKQDAAGYYIAADNDPDARERFRGVSFVPRAMVRKKKVFTVK